MEQLALEIPEMKPDEKSTISEIKDDFPHLKAAEIELVYRTRVKPSDRFKITHSKDMYTLLFYTWNKDKIEFVEEFKVILLNRGMRVLGIYEVSIGGITGTVADPRLILVAALKANACAIILAHNHPSGSLRPSYTDEQLTAKIKNACQFLDIRLLDHIIVTSESYFSFADQGLL